MVRITESFIPQLAMEFLHGGVKTTRFSNTFREVGYETLYEKTADGEYVDSGKKNPIGILQLDYTAGLNITIDPNVTQVLEGIDTKKTYYRKIDDDKYEKASINQRLYLVVMPSLSKIKHGDSVLYEPEYNRFDGATGMALYRDKGRNWGTYDMLGQFGTADPNDFRDSYAIVLCSDARLLDARSYVKNDDGSYSYAPEDYDIDDTYSSWPTLPRAEAFDAWFYVGSRRTKFLVLMPSELAKIRIDVSREFTYDEDIYNQEERYVFKPITRYIVENQDDFDTLDNNSLFRIHLKHAWNKKGNKLELVNSDSYYEISFGRRVDIDGKVTGDYNYPPFISKSYLSRRREFYKDNTNGELFDYYDIYENKDAIPDTTQYDTIPLNKRWYSAFSFNEKINDDDWK